MENPYLTQPGKPIGSAVGAIQSSFAAQAPKPAAPAPLTPQQTQNRAARQLRRQGRAQDAGQTIAKPMPPPQQWQGPMEMPTPGQAIGQPIPSTLTPAPGGFNPTSMISAIEPMQRAQQMEKMARPAPVRQALNVAQTTGAVPGYKPL